VAYLERKLKDAIEPSQIEWFDAAFRDGILTPNQVAVIDV
jgi:hypothetical protein